MAVAPSFQSFTQLCEPFAVNGKQYVKVRNEKTGTERTVRWYPDKEISKSTTVIQPKGTQKEALGFAQGYITIFSGIDETNEDYFKANPAFRYATWWGWYVISTEEVPSDLPTGVITAQLDWNSVGKDNKLIAEDKVREAAEALFAIPVESNSAYVGEVGQRIAIELTVIKNIPVEGEYGHSTIHIFEDSKGNQFVWSTASKNWGVGTVHKVRATIKEHKKHSGICQTVVQRCTEY